MSGNSELFKKGFKNGIPIGIGYIPMAMATAIMAFKTGISFGILELMSALLYSCSAMSALINLIANGETLILMYVLTFSIINCRHILLSLSLAQKIDPKMGTLSRIAFAIFNTDETFAVSMNQKGKLSAPYLFGICILPYLGQAIGVTLGFIFTQMLPDYIKSAFGITLYAMLAGLIVPPMRKSKSVVIIVLIAGVFNTILETNEFIRQRVSSGILMMSCVIITCLIGAIFFPVKPADDGEIENKDISDRNM